MNIFAKINFKQRTVSNMSAVRTVLHMYIDVGVCYGNWLPQRFKGASFLHLKLVKYFK